jgi:hypothetical protein
MVVVVVIVVYIVVILLIQLIHLSINLYSFGSRYVNVQNLKQIY